MGDDAAGERKRKYVYGKERDEVHAKWIDLHKQAAAGPVATTMPTLGQYLADWLREIVKPNLAPLTASTYETITRLYIVPGLGDKRLDRLSVRDVQTWLNGSRRSASAARRSKDARRPEAKRRCCAVGACCKRYPSARTIKDVRTVLRAALSCAITDELISRNVARMVKTAGRPDTQADRRGLATRRGRSSRRPGRDGDPLYAAYVLVLVLGLRKGEVLGLALGGHRPGRGRADHRLPTPAGPPAAACTARPRPKRRTPRCRCPTSAWRRCGAGKRSRTRPGWRPARRGRAPEGRARLHRPVRHPDRPAHLQSDLHGRSAKAGVRHDHRARRPADLRLRCSPTWTCTHASRCRSCGTPTSA